jgi:hypothetical protein
MLPPLREHSAARTECGISVSNTRIFCPIVAFREAMMFLALLVRLSTIVSRIPSMRSLGLIVRLTLETEPNRRFRPLVDKKLGCDGMIRLSAATRALIVIIPREGMQSIRI